jgi:CHRD domain-containing protein/flagellar hook capping protein FlgD
MTPRRRTHHILALSLLAFTSFAALPARAAVYVYSCILNPRQETPPLPVGPLGAGRFVIDTDANTVTYRIVFSGLTSAESQAHIHGFVGPGTPGGVLVALPAGNPKVGVWNYAEGDEANILAGLTYANIHTANNPGGELRGQIVPFNALLDAAQETPNTGSAAKGWATATIDLALHQISYYLFYEGLTGAALSGHFHGNVLQGTPAPVKIGLTVTPSPMTGTVSYGPADEGAILAGRFYLNLHTAAFPGGEIRGQFVQNVIPMDAGQEVPAVPAPTSAGFGLVAIDTLANTLGYDVRIAGLSSTEQLAHIHGFAGPTANASVLQALPLGTQKLGTWVYGAANEVNVLAGLTYFNSHTSNNPGGEIRGQIDKLAGSASVLGVGGGSRLTAGLAASPNPFGLRTQLSFQLSKSGSVSLSIVGVDGRIVRHVPAALFAPGAHSYEWDGRDDDGHPAAPGVYFAVVRTPEGEKISRLARLR